ncbi:MAG: sigma factor-like helix-turn-helix DNA-binding protein [Phycisphaerales bacterium]
MGIKLYDFLPGGWVGSRFSRQTSDLRCDLSSTLRSLSAHLPEHDRLLLERYLIDGVPTASLAAELGVSARTVNRRVHTLLARAQSPEYRYVAREYGRMARIEARIAHALFCEGLPIRAAALRVEVGLHKVRVVRTKVKALARAPRAAQSSGVAA